MQVMVQADNSVEYTMRDGLRTIGAIGTAYCERCTNTWMGVSADFKTILHFCFFKRSLAERCSMPKKLIVVFFWTYTVK